MSALAAALCTLVLSADPAPSGVVVLLSRRTAVPQAEGRELAAQVAALLGKAGLPLASDAEGVSRRLARLGVKDTANCNGRKVCIAELARQLEAPWVVALSVSRIESDRSLALELIRAQDVAVVAKDSVVLAKADKLTSDLLAGFVDKARTAMGLAPPPGPVVTTPPTTPDKPPPDAPVQTALTPPPPSTPPVLPPPPPEKSHTASYVLGGAGVLALGAAATMLALGLSTRTELARGQNAGGRTLSELTEPQAVQLNSRSNVELGVAAGAGALGLGLGTAAVLVW